MDYLLTVLALAQVVYAPPEAAKPVIVVAGSKELPSPIPTSVKLTGAEFEILTLTGYAGFVTWDVSAPDNFTPPVELVELAAKEKIIGVRVGNVKPGKHEAPETPAVAVFSVGAGQATLAAWGVRDGKPVKLATFAINANVGPHPPPIPPGPQPPEPKPPTPAPEGFRVIFVYETSQPMTAAMQQVMFGEKVRTYLDIKSRGWRRFDKDVDAANEKDANLKALWLAARPQVTVVPCVIIAVGGKADILPFPASEDLALELLKKYGG